MIKLAVQALHVHRWDIVSSANGFVTYRCSRCPAEKTEKESS